MNQRLPSPGRTGFHRTICIAACVFSLAACDRAEVSHSQAVEPINRSQSLEPSALMQLRFPASQGNAQDALQELKAPPRTGNEKSSPNTIRAKVVPIRAVQLDETHAVLLTEVVTGQDCHACSGIMGAYFFERDPAGWRLTASHDVLVETGVDGRLGNVAVSKLDGSQHAATIEWGSCWQGNCGNWLVVVGLRANSATLLSQGIQLSQTNDGAYGSCSILDKSKNGNEPENEDDKEAAQHDCLEINGKWRFDGARLIVAFDGRIREVKSGAPQAPRQIHQQAVYEVGQDGLKLVEGENPVRGF